MVNGYKRGTSLGFRTENMRLHRLHSPVAGIYVTRVNVTRDHGGDRGIVESSYPAVTSVGTRPMFDGEGMRLETHILDFDETLYTKHIRVVFLKKLRPEEKFSNVDDLIKAIETDIEDARLYFANNSLITENNLGTD